MLYMYISCLELYKSHKPDPVTKTDPDPLLKELGIRILGPGNCACL